MGLFSFIEIFFFISLGITIILIAMLVYHFKQRVSSLEQKYESLFDIVSNVVKQLRNIQSMSLPNNSKTPMNLSHPGVFSKSDPYIYLGNDSPVSGSNIFHNWVDPYTVPITERESNIDRTPELGTSTMRGLSGDPMDSSRFIIDYNTQFIREMPNMRDNVILEDETESDDESESDSESDDESVSDSDTSYINMRRGMNVEEPDIHMNKRFIGDDVLLQENKIVVSDDDNTQDIYIQENMEDIEPAFQDNYDVKIITLPNIMDVSLLSGDGLSSHDEARTQEVGTTGSVRDLSGDGLSSKDKEVHEFEPIVIDDVSSKSNLLSQDNKANELYKKMTLPNLKATVITKGLCSDPSKMKKADLLKLLEGE